MCSCLPEYQGAPPNCRPECTSSAECPTNRACINRKCVDPCPGVCGQGAQCQVRNHSPICMCPPPLIGDPFVRCLPRPTRKQRPKIDFGMPKLGYTCRSPSLPHCKGIHSLVLPLLINISFVELLAPSPPPATPYRDPCVPSPCGLYATCRNQQDQAVCACQPNYFGTPPHCRPECTINADCPTQLACINEKCGDPCAGACGQNTECRVINHTPNCVCLQGYVGDAFVACRPAPRKQQIGNSVGSEIKRVQFSVAPPAYEEPRDPCNPSPCGNNAMCSGDGQCTCLAEYQGDPYVSCRPECVLSSECARNRACVNQKCVDPCPGTCGASAICEVVNHIAMCHCPEGMTGNAFIHCSPVQSRFHLATILSCLCLTKCFVL